MAPLRMTLTAQLVLRALLADPGREVYGREVMQRAGLASGTVYPILARLEAEGWVKSRAEVIDKRAEGRPARRYYKLTPKGTEKARAAVARGAARLAALDLAPEPGKAPPLNIGGIDIPVITDDRQPPGTVGVISRGREAVSVSAFALAPEEAASEPEDAGLCEHRIPPGSYCARCGRLI